MKNILVVFLSFFSLFLSAQDYSFETEMINSISTIDSCFLNSESTVSLAKRFEQIASLEKEQWLPLYYAAFCYSINAFMQKDPLVIDETLDKVDSLLNQVNLLIKENSEIYCIESLIASARIIVNPRQRGMEYGRIVSEKLVKAMKEDPNNPLIYYLQAQSIMYTPEEYGGGYENAKPLLKIALEKFNTFTPESRIHPNWGKEETVSLLKKKQ